MHALKALGHLSNYNIYWILIIHCNLNTGMLFFSSQSSQVNTIYPRKQRTSNWVRMKVIKDLNHLSSSSINQFSSVQSLCCVQLLVTPWTAARQAFLSIKSVMPSRHLILSRPLLLMPSIFPSIRVFSNESVLHIRWPKFWSFSFNISPSNEYSGLISFRIDWLDLLAV